MNIKSLALATAIVLGSFVANAANTAPVQVTGPSFSDVELGTFTLTETTDVTGALGYAPYVLIAPNIEIPLPPVSFSSVSVYSTRFGLTSFAALSGNTFTFLELASGTYSLRVAGQVQGSNFISALYTAVTLVPEPEAFALFLSGLGLLGFKLRRQLNRGDATQRLQASPSLAAA